ncbi:MAG: flagellin [Thermodesulfobacteriota bacterium]
MRTTLQTINTKILGNLNRLTEDMGKLNETISSQRQMSTPSDSPTNLASALGLRTDLAEIKQYRTNLQYGASFIDASQNSLQQIKDGLIRGKVLALNAINSAMSTENRTAMAMEVANLFEQAVTLANTQVNGKFIFGGYRTAGYDELEPTPFVIGQADGYRITGNAPATLDAGLTGAGVNGGAIAAGDLTINGIAIGAVGASGGASRGLFMDKAAAAVTAINLETPATTVSASLTTLYAGGNATNNGGGDTAVSFDLNGVAVNFTVPAGTSAANVALLTVGAVNAVAGQTGVRAAIGDGSNGGAVNAVVLTNSRAGDASAIDVANMAPAGAPALIGFGNFTQAADAGHNTGRITLTSSAAFTVASPNNPADDTVLDALGLGGGGKGFADDPGDGIVRQGYPLDSGALVINGIPVGAAAADGVSDVFAESSASAKAAAINAVSDRTGVSAVVIPITLLAGGPVQSGTLGSGDLVINGVDIFDVATTAVPKDADSAVLKAINAKAPLSGVAATRDSEGRILLTPYDTSSGLGRNLHLQTSANGESMLQLNSGASGPQDKVYFASVQLRSTRRFTLETTPTTAASLEPGLAAIGLEGGLLRTGEASDNGGDGKLTVQRIMTQDGNVRYTGDRDNDIAVKVGKRNTLDISKNGQAAVMDTGVFTALKDLENYLLGQRFTSVTGFARVGDVNSTLDSGTTGLANEEELVNGTFTVKVSDHAVDPPRELTFKIEVDVAVDSPATIADRINGIPGISAAWNTDGYLEIVSDDGERYTFSLENDSSKFLSAAGITPEVIQQQALDRSLVAIETAMQSLTSQVSDFGARANRIDIQNQIYDNLELATSENLSEMQDTDMLEALMKFRSKETAYQAALSTAARIMQLSLVNFL